jgi:hypothetical protein
MKQALTEFYIHTLDLLWRLSMYYSHTFFSKLTDTKRSVHSSSLFNIRIEQLADAILPRTKYKFSMYLENVKRVATRLKTLCDAGHIAEQKYITASIDILHTGIDVSLTI